MSVTLSYSSIFARDVETLPDFYVTVLGLEEISASRSVKYRELMAGGVKLGFIHLGGYEMLGLAGSADAVGVKSILTFAVTDPATVDRLTKAALARGATLAHAPFRTFFGQYQSVLLDPEGNALRISTQARDL